MCDPVRLKPLDARRPRDAGGGYHPRIKVAYDQPVHPCVPSGGAGLQHMTGLGGAFRRHRDDARARTDVQACGVGMQTWPLVETDARGGGGEHFMASPPVRAAAHQPHDNQCVAD